MTNLIRPHAKPIVKFFCLRTTSTTLRRWDISSPKQGAFLIAFFSIDTKIMVNVTDIRQPRDLSFSQNCAIPEFAAVGLYYTICIQSISSRGSNSNNQSSDWLFQPQMDSNRMPVI